MLLLATVVAGFQLNHRPGFSSRALVGRAASALEEMACLPFAADEVLLPGQSRYLHLYEARFLALFEYATSKCDSELCMGFFVGDGALLATATRARIDSWKQLDVGVGATVTGVARCAVESICTEDRPFLVANVRRVVDDDAESGTSDEDRRALADRVVALYAEVESLARRHSIASRRENELSADPRAFDQPDAATAAAAAKIKADAPQARSLIERACELSARPNGTSSPELELLSFLALEGSELELKLNALTMASCHERLVLAEAELQRQRSELAAKAAIKSLNFT